MGENDRGEDLAPNEPLGYLLKRATEALRVEMSRSVLASLGLGFSQYICMRMLSRGPGMSNAALARQFDVSPQAMNKLVRQLQHRGLVIRPAALKIGRGRPTTLTSDGWELRKPLSSAYLRPNVMC